MGEVTDHSFTDAPAGPEQRRRDMTELARAIDGYFNGKQRGKDRKIGFALITFRFDEPTGGCNYISNSERSDMVRLLEQQLATFKEQNA
jgi:hypothetical protein